MFRKIFLFSVVLALLQFGLALPAQAREYEPEGQSDRGYFVEKSPAKHAHPPLIFEIGIPIFEHELEVDSDPATTYEGVAAGFRMGFEYVGYPLYLRAELTAGFSQIDTENNSSGDDELDYSMVNFEFDIGMNFENGPLIFTPYVGIGANFLEYTESDKSNAVPLEFNWGYFPIGVRASLRVNPFITVGIDVAARVMFAGEIRLAYSEVDPLLDDETNDLETHVGLRVMIPIDIFFAPDTVRPGTAFNITLLYEQQFISTEESSNPSTPESEDMEYFNVGAIIGLRFYF